METNLRARTLSETRGFLKALVEVGSDRILGFTAFGVRAGEILGAVQIKPVGGSVAKLLNLKMMHVRNCPTLKI